MKIGGKTLFENLLKQLFNSPLFNSRYLLVGCFITSYPTRAHGIIVIWSEMEQQTSQAKKVNSSMSILFHFDFLGDYVGTTDYFTTTLLSFLFSTALEAFEKSLCDKRKRKER